jgi:tRNA dimethylallyltransferase
MIGITGATASGKSGAALALAAFLPVEIVCMDAMQVYRRMDIGTAKPTKEEQGIVPHHQLDIVSPGEPFSVAEYAEGASARISEIHARNHIPLLVGGTGLYLRALSYPLSFGGIKGNEEVRKRYAEYADLNGRLALHSLLAQRDPLSAARLSINDTHRVIRALEVLELTGIPFSAQVMPSPDDCPYTFYLYALSVPRASLYERIDRRVDSMIASGLVTEVEGLLKSGVSSAAQSMQGLGYKELIPVISGGSGLGEAILRIKQRTRNYAKRQLTWFGHDPRISWLDAETEPPAVRIMKDMVMMRNDKD